MNRCVLLLTLILLNVDVFIAQNSFWGLTSKGGTSNAGIIYQTNTQGQNLSVRYHAKLLNDAYLPSEYTGMVEHPQTKEIYFVTEEGGSAGTGGLFKFNPNTSQITNLANFTGINGKRPHGGLIIASNHKIYGTTKDSEADVNFPDGTAGSIFEFDTETNTFTTLFKFNETNGKNPYATLYQASDGKLYGTTSGGGNNGNGVLFAYDILNSSYAVLHSFSTGKAPFGGVVEVSGKLYGATSLGGIADKGIIYEFDIATQSITVMVHFSTSHSGYMKGAFVEVNNELYGVTNGNQQVTGAYGKLLKYTPGETSCSVLHSFMIFTSGTYPIGGLCVKDNVLIGSLEGGPLTPRGTIFEYNLTATTGTEFSYTALNSLSQIDLKGTLIHTSNGIFGLTKSAGSSNNGSLYTYNRAESPKNITDVASFKIDVLGSNPVGKITHVVDGKLYGNMQTGGEHRSGVLFSFNPKSNEFNAVYNFPKDSKPNGSMALVGNHRLYGMSETGGDNNQGYVFEYNTAEDVFQIIHHFDTTQTDHKTFNDDNLGALPKGGFTLINDSILYGTTSHGGFANEGLLFKLVASKHNANSIQKLVSFDKLTGSEPSGDLEKIGDYLFGMTYNGGTLVPGGGQGTIFRYKIGGTYEPLVAFKGGDNGEYPIGSMTANNDKLYAFTHGKRYNNAQLGVLFEYDPENPYTHNVLHKFIGSSSESTSVGGAKPYGKMTLSTNGKLYGTTSRGSGMSATGGDYGVLFEFDPTTNMYTSVETFTGPNGATPGINSELVIVCAADASATVDQANEKIIANESNADSYQWYSVNVNSDQRTLIPDATTREFTPFMSGTYSVEVEKDGCANYSDYYSIEVSECDVNSQVDYDAANELFTASEASADAYQWFHTDEQNTDITPIIDANQRAFAPTETGYYQVEITKGNCIEKSSLIFFEKQIICSIDTTLNFDEDLLILTSNEPNAIYQWYEKDASGTLIVLEDETQRVFTPTKSGNYLVEIFANECTAYSESLDYVHEANCTTNASISFDYTLQLFIANEANASAYQWYAVSESTEEITLLEGETNRTFAPTNSGDYKAEVTKNGCSNFSETYTFEKDAECNTNASANYNTDLNIFIANESNASTYQWYEVINESLVAINNENGRAYTPNHTGEYVVEVTKNDCSNYSEPMFYEHVTTCLTDASASFNEGFKIFIANEPSAEKYQWFEVDETDGGLLIIPNATHRTYTPLKSAVYKLEVTKNGCANFSDDLEYDINANCQTEATIIYKEELQLFIASEPNAILYQWFEETAEGLIPIENENNRSFSPSKSGYYMVEVSNNGCSNLSESLHFDYTQSCNTVAAIYQRTSNNSLEATELNADSYTWFKENNSARFEIIPGATERIYFPTKSGNYKVSVSKDGCEKLSESLTYTHFINCTLEAGVSIDPSGTTLVASEIDATRYQWYEWQENGKQLILLENENEETFTPNKSGNYLVEITLDECTDFSSPLFFEYIDPCIFTPIAVLNQENQTIMLDPLDEVQSYEWYQIQSSGEMQLIEGENTDQFMPEATGTYLAKVTLEHNCSQYSNEVYFEKPLICDVTADIYYDVTLQAFVTDLSNAVEYQWYTADNLKKENLQAIPDATGHNFSPTETGFYVLKITVNEDCSAFSEALKYEKPGGGECEVQAILSLDTVLNMLVADDMGNVSYEWFVKDETNEAMTSVATTTEGQYTPVTTGIYVVQVKDGDCSEISNEVYFEASTSSVELSERKVSIFPNPASDILAIQTLNKVAGIEIISLSGKTVYQTNGSNAFSNQLDINELDNGIYFISLTYTNGTRETAKFMKQKR